MGRETAIPNAHVQWALHKALERMDYVKDYYEGSDFVDVIGYMDRNPITYRFYDG
jgi:hypothetical protein